MTAASRLPHEQDSHSSDNPRLYAAEPPSPSAADVFAELKTYVGFRESDAINLRGLLTTVREHLPAIVDRFYQQIQRHADTRDIIGDDPQRMIRLKSTLQDWLESLFCGKYDAAYMHRRARIGRIHVDVGVPQHYMLAAMEVVRQELGFVIVAANLIDASDKLDSLERLLALEAAIMVHSFQSAYVDQVRRRERDAIQERLTRAEHLAQIGQLAASLAHEIKNPLAGISGAIQVIRDSMEPDAPHRPILGEVLRQINRLDQTVKDLLVYARPLPPRFDRCNLGRVIDRLMTVFKREPAIQRIRFEHNADPRPLPTIEADEDQIEQLLMNLVLNAAHASPDDAQVILATRPIHDGVQIEVRDRGHGMDDQTAARALEPFFTTKAKGTGLGLPICRRIVEAHGGTLSIHSIVGQETTVTVQLPLSQPQQSRSEV